MLTPKAESGVNCASAIRKRKLFCRDQGRLIPALEACIDGKTFSELCNGNGTCVCVVMGGRLSGLYARALPSPAGIRRVQTSLRHPGRDGKALR